MKALMLVSWLSCSLIAVAAVLGQPAPTDDNKLKGTWIMVSAVQSGEAIEPLKNARFSFVDGKMTVAAMDKELNLEATFKLDPSKKPREIDIVETSGPAKGVRMKGIYLLEADSLKICFIGLGENEKDQLRTPTEFNGNGNQILYTLKREKP